MLIKDSLDRGPTWVEQEYYSLQNPNRAHNFKLKAIKVKIKNLIRNIVIILR